MDDNLLSTSGPSVPFVDWKSVMTSRDGDLDPGVGPADEGVLDESDWCPLTGGGTKVGGRSDQDTFNAFVAGVAACEVTETLLKSMSRVAPAVAGGEVTAFWPSVAAAHAALRLSVAV